MTEAEWLKCPMMEGVLKFILPNASNRILRLLAVACCRNSWDDIQDKRSRRALEAAEQFADDLVGDVALTAARSLAEAANQDAGHAAWIAEAVAHFRDTPE